MYVTGLYKMLEGGVASYSSVAKNISMMSVYGLHTMAEIVFTQFQIITANKRLIILIIKVIPKINRSKEIIKIPSVGLCV